MKNKYWIFYKMTKNNEFLCGRMKSKLDLCCCKHWKCEKSDKGKQLGQRRFTQQSCFTDDIMIREQ